ncbi:MAG: DUF1080 domain-containing protein, partial [Bacteroidota bacterium]
MENQKDWIVAGDAKWSFNEDELMGEISAGNGFIMTNDVYSDFELELEFFPDSSVNSGVFVRCAQQELSATECHEINIWDFHPTQENRTGAIVNKATYINFVETINRWNTYRIKCYKNTTQVWINETMTAEYKDSTRLAGFIGLQTAMSGTIRFRNIWIK